MSKIALFFSILFLISSGVQATTVRTHRFLYRSDVDYFSKKLPDVKVTSEKKQLTVTPVQLEFIAHFPEDIAALKKECDRVGIFCYHLTAKSAGAQVIDSYLGRKLLRSVKQKLTLAIKTKKLNKLTKDIYIVSATYPDSGLIGEIEQDLAEANKTIKKEQKGRSNKSYRLSIAGLYGNASSSAYQSIDTEFYKKGKLSKKYWYFLDLGLNFQNDRSSGAALIARESYIRTRGKKWRATGGYYQFHWGGGILPNSAFQIFRVNRRDYFLGNEQQERLPLFVLNGEYRVSKKLKTMVAFTPFWQSQLLAPKNSIWSPYSQKEARLLGYKPNENLKALIENGEIEQEFVGGGAIALRAEYQMKRAGAGVLIQLTPGAHSSYLPNSQIAQLLQQGVPIDAILAQLQGDALQIDDTTTTIFSADYKGVWKGYDYTLEVGSAQSLSAVTEAFGVEPSSALLFNLRVDSEIDPYQKIMFGLSQKSPQSSSKSLNNLESQKLVFQWNLHEESSKMKYKFRYASDFADSGQFFELGLIYKGLDQTTIGGFYRSFDGDEESQEGLYKNNSGLGVWVKYDLF